MRRIGFLILLLLLAGCNLESFDAVTPPPTATAYVAPTPYRGPTAIVAPTLIGSGSNTGAQTVPGTPVTVIQPTAAPTQQTIPIPQAPAGSQNVIEAFFDNLVIPLISFVYSFVTEGAATLWLFAGAQGGALAQLLCCLVPVLVVGGLLLRRLRVGRWRR
ncbi:MAG: hypothetical protein IT319_07905 [Anaerolineae bacterium]|nr:hypothetical protein [Anaerolineae bacterium]